LFPLNHNHKLQSPSPELEQGRLKASNQTCMKFLSFKKYVAGPVVNNASSAPPPVRFHFHYYEKSMLGNESAGFNYKSFSSLLYVALPGL